MGGDSPQRPLPWALLPTHFQGPRLPGAVLSVRPSTCPALPPGPVTAGTVRLPAADPSGAWLRWAELSRGQDRPLDGGQAQPQYLPHRPLTRAQGGHGLFQPSGRSPSQTQTECWGCQRSLIESSPPDPTRGLREPRMTSPFLHCYSQTLALPRGGGGACGAPALPVHQRPSHPRPVVPVPQAARQTLEGQ